MHHRLINDASFEQLKEFLTEMFDELKDENHELYKEYEMELYKDIYGCHFNEWLLKEATSKMINEDGTHGSHWSIESTNSLARSKGLEFKEFNQYDFNYVMNMIYSDYYGAVSNDVDIYYKMALKFLHDKDGRENKAFHYYCSSRY